MVRFRESLTPSPLFHLALALLIPMGFGMLAPIDIGWGVVNAAVLYGTSLIVFVVFAPRIVVTESELRAGRAHIPIEYVGLVTPVERDDRSAALADARQWRLVRAWIPTGVLIDITDPADPTPTWYLSTRKAQQLAESLAR